MGHPTPKPALTFLWRRAIATSFTSSGQPGCTGFNGLNLFFDGNNSTPGISAFAITNSSDFLANGNATLTLQGAPVTGAGRTSYSSGGAIMVLNSYDWTDMPANSPGDVCQAFWFAPGGGVDYSGSITLEVWPAAALTKS